MASQGCAAYLAANVKRCRRHVGFSQEEVGARAGLHRTEIGLLERGERVPRIDTLIKLAGALGVDRRVGRGDRLDAGTDRGRGAASGGILKQPGRARGSQSGVVQRQLSPKSDQSASHLFPR